MHILHQLAALGQSIWYDNISRSMVRNGTLQRMVDEGLLGVTSNPTIFDNAISGSTDYDEQITTLVRAQPGISTPALIRALMEEDIRDAADILLPVYRRTGGKDGYISIEVDPTRARDTEGTIREAAEIWGSLKRPNVMIKIPATLEGLPAITRTIAAGINVNVTLIFSEPRYRQVVDAWMRGLEERVQHGQDVAGVASVASVFVSRIDTMVDERLSGMADRAAAEDAARLRALAGRAAVANTRLVYAAFKEIVASDRWRALQAKGASVQRPLWGSTGTKNKAYSDLLYVGSLIGPDTVNTVPPATYAAILSHGTAVPAIESGVPDAAALIGLLQAEGISMSEVLDALERDGVASFERSFDGLLRNVENKRKAS
ncbi:MAG: transaldolase [Ignavibacteriae bacterium]|nr:transaldolase [Ignavibacteriota bacterium]